jgi:threonine/homoserine/homoserine lactone efflux protein
MVMVEFLVTGVILGLSAGLSPGPLLTLVIAETVRHGAGAGIRVAMAPVLSDLPIIVLTLLVLQQVAELNAVLGAISLAGALFLCYLGIQGLRSTGLSVQTESVITASLTKGVWTNLLNPHPYLFWLTVGGTFLSRAQNDSTATAGVFLLGFYGCLVGSKVVLALLVGRSRALLTGRTLTVVLRLLGALLCLLGIGLALDGLSLLGLRSLG